MMRKAGFLSFLGLTLSVLISLVYPCSSLTAAEPPLRPLDHRVVDAEYSKALDRIITVATTPLNRLHVYDPETGEDAPVDLPHAPTCVSVGPDGLYAAVGHDGWMSYVDLSAPALIKTIPVTTNVFDIVLAGNGHAYAFPNADEWDRVRCINLESGSEALHTGKTVINGSRAKLHPGGSAIYVADRYNHHDGYLRKLSIENGLAEYLHDISSTIMWESHERTSSFLVGGNLWISEDGSRIFTRSGKMFRSSESRGEDMEYNGSLEFSYKDFLEKGQLVHLDHSMAAGKVLVIWENAFLELRDDEVWIYDHSFLNLNQRVKLPKFTIRNDEYSSHGKFVFANSAGDKYHVIIQTEEISEIPQDYAIVSFLVDYEGKAHAVSSSAGPGGNISPAGNISVNSGKPATFTISPNPGYQVADVLIDGNSVGKVSTYTFHSITEDHAIDAVFSRISNDGSLLINSLGYRVIDAEYSKELNRIVMISAQPKNRLHVYDPETGESSSVDLPLAPICVSVGPGGRHAAVGHDGWVSHVDLTTPRLLKTIPVSIKMFDIVLAGNGFAYVFPDTPTFERLWCVNLDTGEELLNTGPSIGERSQAKLHPGGNAIYLVNYPNNLLKMDITNGVAQFLYSSHPSNHYPTMYQGLWISEDGARIFTGGRDTFSSSEIQSEDMINNGTLEEIGDIEHLDHSLAAAMVLAIPTLSYDSWYFDQPEVWVYDHNSLELRDKIRFPKLFFNGKPFQSHGRFVFFNREGDRFFAIVQADETSGTHLDYAVASYPADLGSLHFTLTTVAEGCGDITPSGVIPVSYGESVTFTSTPELGCEVTDVLVDGVPLGKVDDYTIQHVTDDHEIQIVFQEYADYFGVQVGSSRVYSNTQRRMKWESIGEVVEFDRTTFPEPTYLVHETTDGRVGQSWLQRLPEGLGVRQMITKEGTVIFSKPLIMIPYPMADNIQWVSETSSFMPPWLREDVRLTGKVSRKKIVNTPAGTFLAYPISYRLEKSGPLGKTSSRWTEWFVPYVGTVMSRGLGTSSQLTRLAVGGGRIVTPPPIVKSSTSLSGRPGDKISIKGYNLQDSSGTGTLSIGGTEVTDILSWSDGLIECLIPPGAVSGPVTVSTEGLKSNEDIVYHMAAPPEITAVSPSGAAPGSLVTVQGINFGKRPPRVTVGGMRTVVQRKSLEYDSFVCTVPRRLGSGTHDITVTTQYGSHTLPGALTVSGP